MSAKTARIYSRGDKAPAVSPLPRSLLASNSFFLLCTYTLFVLSFPAYLQVCIIQLRARCNYSSYSRGYILRYGTPVSIVRALLFIAHLLLAPLVICLPSFLFFILFYFILFIPPTFFAVQLFIYYFRSLATGFRVSHFAGAPSPTMEILTDKYEKYTLIKTALQLVDNPRYRRNS